MSCLQCLASPLAGAAGAGTRGETTRERLLRAQGGGANRRRAVAACATPGRGSQKNATSASSRLISALSAVAVAAALTTSPMFPTTASEFNIRIQNQPEGYVLDDARLLSQDTQKDVAKKLAELEEETGYKVIVITLSKLEYDPSAGAFAEKMVVKWYPTLRQGDNKGVLVLVADRKQSAFIGGPSLMRQVGDEMADLVVDGNMTVYAKSQEYDKAIMTSVDRIIAAIEGKEDPGGPAPEPVKRPSSLPEGAIDCTIVEC